MKQKKILVFSFLICFLVEILIGVGSIFVYNLSYQGNILGTILPFIGDLLHYAIYGIIFSALMDYSAKKERAKGWFLAVTFLITLTIRSLFLSTYTNLLNNYTFGDSLFAGLLTSLLNTFLVESLFLGFSFLLTWIIFQYQRQPDSYTSDVLDFKTNYAVTALLLFAIFFFARKIISESISFVSFAIDNYWMFKTTEIITILSHYLLVFLGSILCYLSAFSFRYKVLSKQ